MRGSRPRRRGPTRAGTRTLLVVDPGKGGLPETTLRCLGGRHDGKLARRETVLSAGSMRSIPAYKE
ncbi:hypothetical protein [Streptomyces sp. NPDC097981]|uniref:hypothetical protein n=1 Tax=Streptomyces sp. NPDC097981 TaxID=3155428 RepID=UPI003318A934